MGLVTRVRVGKWTHRAVQTQHDQHEEEDDREEGGGGHVGYGLGVDDE